VNVLIPLLGRLFGRDSDAYRYLPGSIGEFLTPAEFADLLYTNGYQDIFIERMIFGVTHIIGGKKT
jgi:demethylmenaquinone methyltransferase/2-methoxy-6-polyprenyl-1,4-benzoquinol methylase